MAIGRKPRGAEKIKFYLHEWAAPMTIWKLREVNSHTSSYQVRQPLRHREQEELAEASKGRPQNLMQDRISQTQQWIIYWSCTNHSDSDITL